MPVTLACSVLVVPALHLRPACPCARLAPPISVIALRLPSVLRKGRHRPFRQAVAASSGRVSGGGGGDDSTESIESAFDAVQTCMNLFISREQSSDLDSLVEYLPEAVIDRLLERKRAKLEEAGATVNIQKEDLCFVELLSLAQPSDLALDAFAARGVLSAPPRSAQVLSSLKLSPERFLQRYAVVARSGEEMVLIFDMQLEECLQPKYRGLQIVKRWLLKGITGEPAYPGDLPSQPKPCWGPDAVVLAQLAALQQDDAAGVFRFASPTNQAATGPVERFQQMLQVPAYRPLLQHVSADILRTVQMTPECAVMIVGVLSNIPTSEAGVMQRAVYSWTVRLQGEEAGPQYNNCWMTEAVQPISQSLSSL